MSRLNSIGWDWMQRVRQFVPLLTCGIMLIKAFDVVSNAQEVGKENNMTDFLLPLSKSAFLPDSSQFYALADLKAAYKSYGDVGLILGIVPIKQFNLEAGFHVVAHDEFETLTGFSFSMNGVVVSRPHTRVAIGARAFIVSYESGSENRIYGPPPTDDLTVLNANIVVSHSFLPFIVAHLITGYTYYNYVTKHRFNNRDETKNIIPVSLALSYNVFRTIHLNTQYIHYFPSFEYLENAFSITASWQPSIFYLESGFLHYFNTEYENPSGFILRFGFVF